MTYQNFITQNSKNILIENIKDKVRFEILHNENPEHLPSPCQRFVMEMEIW